MGWGELGKYNLDEALYNVQYKSHFTEPENNQIKNLKHFSKMHDKLSGLTHEEAWTKYNTLDSDTKSGLQYLYGGSNEYMTAPTSGLNSVFTGVKSFVGNFNPLTMLWKGVIEPYGRILENVGDVVSSSLENEGDKLFEAETWSNAFSDKIIFNEELDKELTKKYGKEYAFIAKQHLNGKLPGEILKARGSLNAEFLKAFEDYANNQNGWADGILEDYKQAQVSVGRWAARNILGKRSGAGDQDDTAFTMVSGFIDAAYAVLSDPLTYATGGLSNLRFFGKAVSLGAKATDLARAGNIAGVFKIGRVAKYWDDYGNALGRLDEARKAKNTDLAGQIVQEIKIKFPEHGTDEEIDMLLKGTDEIGPITDAKKAEKFFSQFENTARLIQGRTSDTSYYRNSVALAKNHISVTQKFRQTWYDMAVNKATKDVKGDDVAQDIIKKGTDISSLQNVDTPALDIAMKAQQTRANRILNQLRISAGDESIMIIDTAKASVASTLENVKAIAGQIMDPRLANAFGERFLASSPEERFVMMRGLYVSVFESLGLDKAPAGRELLNEVLSTRFGGAESAMTSFRNLAARDGFDITEDTLKLDGAIHSGQATATIANLPWSRMQEVYADTAFQSLGKSTNSKGVWALMSTVGGAMNGTLSGKLTNFWSFFTLAPRLGLRSTIDEMFMFYLTAPANVFLNYKKGRRAGYALTAATGASGSQGVISRGGRKWLQKAYDNIAPTAVKGKKSTAIDLINSIPIERRQEIFAETVEKAGANETGEAISILYFKALGMEAAAMAGVVGDEAFDDVVDAIAAGITDIGSAASSIARATGASRNIDSTLQVAISTPSALTKVEKALAVEYGDFYQISPKNLNDFQKTVIQYQSFFTRFFTSYAGSKSLGEVFINNNGLRTAADFDKATDEVMQMFINDRARGGNFLNEFIQARASTVKLRGKFKDDDLSIAREQIRLALNDMNSVFHGGANKFNDKLLADLQVKFAAFKEASPNLEWRDFFKQYSIEEYKDLVKGNLFDKDFNTNIIKIEDWSTGYQSWYKNFGERAWQAMDETVTGFARQPVVMAYYLANRKANRVLETQKVRQFISQNPDISEEMAESIVRRQFAQIAMKDAMHQTLKYVDNPHIRTNLATSVRNVSRFARATEDFWRRVYRLKDVTPQAIYRTRLLHNGLSGTGIIEEDQNGDEYFVIPIDNILHATLDPVLRAMSGGGTGFVQPQYQRFTTKLTAVNPSFQEDGGIPFLSGPTAAVSVLTLKSIAGTLGGEAGQKFGDNVGQILIGDYNTNLTLRSAITPAMINRVWSALDTNEKNAANHSATLSAIAYNQAAIANGKPIHPGQLPTASAEDRADYLKQIRISGHNLVAIRSLMGIISPFSLSTQDSMNIPEYLRDNGVLSFSSEFSSILQAVQERYGDDISDPYELATALFIGEHPGKLIYTVSKNGKGTTAYLQRTKQVKDWLTGNKDFIDAYGEAAYFFAPQDGELDLSMYQYMEAAGLYEDVEVEEYLTRVQVAEDKAKYFKIGKNIKEKLGMELDYTKRKLLIGQGELKKEELKRSNPLLEKSLMPDGGFGVENEKSIASNLKSIVESPNSPLSNGQRKKLNAALTIFERAYSYVSDPNVSSLYEASARKRQMRDRAINDLLGVSRGDAVLMQLLRKVFEPILEFHARDSISATAQLGPEG